MLDLERYNEYAEALEMLDPDSLTPREALETLYRLRSLLDG